MQPDFVLTRDIVPINVITGGYGSSSCTFVCPLPSGYQKVVQAKEDEIQIMSNELVAKINGYAETAAAPFEDILREYKDRTGREQRQRLTQFKITRVGIDDRGVYVVRAGNDAQSGNVKLSSEAQWNCDRSARKHSEMFEPCHAFYCHSVDFYWQALLTREFCIEYFNWLNKQL